MRLLFEEIENILMTEKDIEIIAEKNYKFVFVDIGRVEQYMNLITIDGLVIEFNDVLTASYFFNSLVNLIKLNKKALK